VHNSALAVISKQPSKTRYKISNALLLGLKVAPVGHTIYDDKKPGLPHVTKKLESKEIRE